MLVLLQEELEHLGYDVMSAISGQAALELIHSDADIDLVITDVVMPGGIGGYELATLIRDKSPRSAILYMSGNGQWPCERAGHPAAPLLKKPCPPGDLAAAVRSALQTA